MTTNQVIIIARKHVNKGQVSSARLCLEDAVKLYDSGDYDCARQRAIRSLEYSVGHFHADYQKVIGLK